MQYNILADAAVPADDGSGNNICGSYSYCPKEFRYMESRHHRIIDEIKYLSPDVVTLQEVESEHFYEKLRPDLKSMGYKSAEHIRWFDHIGLAIFFKKSKFKLVADYAFIIHKKVDRYLKRYDLDPETVSTLREHMILSSTYTGIIQPPGCLMVKLALRSEPAKIICIGTTHITWKKFQYPVLQILQTACVINELLMFCSGYPIVLSGDFNSTPDMAVYKFVSSGKLDDEELNLLKTSNSYLDSHLSVNGRSYVDIVKNFYTGLELLSSYKSIMQSEPKVTSCDEGQGEVRCECLDYIFATSELKPIRVLDAPPEHLVTQNVAIPSSTFPSDHLPLYAEFCFS